DGSVTRLKGAGRPVQPVQARAEVLAALEAVDLVAVFEEDTPEKLIALVKPTVLVQGADYNLFTGVIGALHQNGRLYVRDELFGRVLLEHRDKIDGFKRGQYFGPRLDRLHRTAG